MHQLAHNVCRRTGLAHGEDTGQSRVTCAGEGGGLTRCLAQLVFGQLLTDDEGIAASSVNHEIDGGMPAGGDDFGDLEAWQLRDRSDGGYAGSRLL